MNSDVPPTTQPTAQPHGAPTNPGSIPPGAASMSAGAAPAPPAAGDGPRAGLVKEGKHHKDWKRERVQVKVNHFTGTPGSKRSAQSKRATPVLKPIEYWRMFFDDNMIREVTEETNAYKHRLRGQAHQRPAHLRPRCSWPPKWTERQKDRDVRGLEFFIGALYALGVGDRGSCSVRDMLRNDTDAEFTEVGWMKRRGITEAWLTGWFQNLHLQPEGWEKSEEAKRPAPNAVKKDGNDERAGDDAETSDAGNIEMPHNHNVKKAGRLLEQLTQNCLAVYAVHMMIAIDEQTALCNSRWASLKHVQRHKKYDGIRIYSINGSSDEDAGYTQYFMVDWKCGYHPTVFADKLLDVLDPVWYNVYLDNAFTTVNNLLKWREQSINACGTSRTTFGFPTELAKMKRPSTSKNPVLKKGEHQWLMSPDGLLAALWHDVGYCQFLSNFHEPDVSTCARRVKKGDAEYQNAVNGRIQRATLLGIMMYNKFMGGTDRCDALRGFNTTQRKSVKWWHSLFFWALDVAYVNAYTVYLHDQKASGAKEEPLSRKIFITRIAQDLMGPVQNAAAVGKKRKAEELEVEEGKWYCPGEKFSVIAGEGKKINKRTGKRTARKLQCQLCIVKGVPNKPQGRYECLGCGYAFHDKCFREAHDEYVTCVKIV